MSGSEVEKVWQCIVCGKAWNKKPSLQAHMKVHKHQGYMRTSIIVMKDEWKEFNKFCDDRKTSSCMVLRDVIKAMLAGEKQGIVTIATRNPLIVQLNHVVMGAPRGRYSHFEGRSMLERLEDPKNKKYPPSCPETNSYWESDRSIGCLKIKERVSVKECWECWLQSKYGPQQTQGW